VIDIRARTGTSRAWAAQVRRNLLAHASLPNSPFFLMVLPDRIYLWKDAGNEPELVEPTYEIDAAPIFQPYFNGTTISLEDMTAEAFKIIAIWWLNTLTWVNTPANLQELQDQMLQESGLLYALRDGHIAITEPA
jgi:hypothetical protein